ncbi:MAG: M1 family metallopeptidase [Chitinophagales bacterium]
MKNSLIILFAAAIFFSSCKTTKNIDANNKVETLAPIEVIGTKKEYKGSEERKFDILHTDLNVSFSWQDQQLFGEANIKLKPYFYSQNHVELDAKGMDIRQVLLISSDSTSKELKYKYDGLIIDIALDKTYSKTEVLDIYIKYISKPNDLKKADGLTAITDDKGLFFINPLGEDKNKPRQIWTQGEPESNSVWFPTIDHPNERCSQEISITIENNFMAMSNGFIKEKVDNKDGTYTITWRQDKPHAPYLFMMAIGEFAEVKDTWKGMSVNYYVEKEYEDVARQIFGKTPEMLTYFSDVLGVPYQWDKYWQVIVRDYVSGAMENTTAVIFGEFVQQTERELLDSDHEDIVAHELFHHWFGDLVTCESWSNLPLNESFATYGEVMWKEFKYGKDEKYLKVKQDMDGYFREAKNGKQVDMIRFNYDSPEDMFDSHSYAKGGVILNMLREVIGDEAFFTSLQTYLWDNKYQTVEIHQLRLAVEEVTGQDFNWFFNQWFLSSGHPILDVNYIYTDTSVKVIIKQEPSNEEYLLYKLPIAIDIYEGYEVRRENIVVSKKVEEFEFKTSVKPELVNVDAEKYLLAEINDNKTEQNYIVQYNNAKNMVDKLQALEFFAAQETITTEGKNVFSKAVKDDFWYIQKKALSMMNPDDMNGSDYSVVANLAENAEKSSIQAEAIYLLSETENKQYKALYKKGLVSKSYAVNAASLNALSTIDSKAALEQAAQWENIDNRNIIDEVGYVYSQEGDKTKQEYYQRMVNSSSLGIYKKFYSIYHYSIFLGKMDNETVLNGVNFIENWGKNETESPYSNAVALAALRRVSNQYVIKADSYGQELQNATGLSSSQKMALENEYADLLLVIDRIQEASDNLSKAEE